MTIIKMKPLAQACALVLAAGGLTMGNAIAAPTPAGSTISNKVTVTYQDASGNTFSDESNTIDISIREVRSATLDADSDKVANTTDTHVKSLHTLTNTGNIAETYTLTAANVDDNTDTLQAGEFRIWKDQDENGILDATDYDNNSPITTITLAAGESVQLIMETMFPASISATDNLVVTLQAVDSTNNEAVDMDTVSTTFTDGTEPTTPIKVWKQANGGNCHAYTYIATPTSIHDAKIAAANLVYGGVKGHLLSPTSQNEWKFAGSNVVPLKSGGKSWIGLEATTGTDYKWPNGDALGSYKNWGKGEGKKADENYVAVQRGKGWIDVKDVNPDNSTREYGYTVEFDTACPAPKVNVALTAAKDATCDGKADGAFADVDLADMASGECAIMHMRAENTNTADALNINFKQIIPQFTSYIPNTISVCGFEDDCKLTERTDSNPKNKGDWAHYDAKTGTVVIGGYWKDKPTVMPKGGILHAEYRVKID